MEMIKNHKSSVGIIIVILLVGAATGIYWLNNLRNTLTTDNAKVTAELVEVSSRVPGKLENLLVTEGQNIKAGQVLAKLEDSQYRINLEQAEAGLRLAKANYAKLPADVQSAAAVVEKSLASLAAETARYQSAQVTYEDAQRQIEESQALYQAGAISKEAFEMASSNYSRSQSALDVAAANIRACQATLTDSQARLNSLNNSTAPIYLAQIETAASAYNNAKLSLDNTTIKAEFDGTIIRITSSKGENLSAGQTIMTIADLTNLWITANIQEKHISRIVPGQKVEVRIDAYPRRFFSGTVAGIGYATQSTFTLIPTESSSGNFTKVAQRIPVKIKVDNSDLALKPGMSAIVKIHTR